MRFNYATSFLFIIPFLLLGDSAHGESLEIQMDWMIEGQLDIESNTSNESKLTSNYQELTESKKNHKITYDKFIIDNEYAIGDHKITINSKEGQQLNAMLIDQIERNQDSFKHKIKYYDRFSDGYIEIAEALLEPIGEQRYLIDGRAYDYYPNSNLEFFLLERGYTLENLEIIPNDVFSPTSLEEARQVIANSVKYGTPFDLNELSPNYMRLDQEQSQKLMMESITEQTSTIFNEIITGKKSIPQSPLSEQIIPGSQIKDYDSIFENLKLEKPKFENTKHVRDSLVNPISTFETSTIEEFLILVLIPVCVGIIVFIFLLRQKILSRKESKPLVELTRQQIDFQKLTKEMLSTSLDRFNQNSGKEAFEILSHAIRFYYSKKLNINKELTNFELLTLLKEIDSSEYENIKSWLILCGSVEYAKYKSHENDFKKIIDSFSNLIT